MRRAAPPTLERVEALRKIAPSRPRFCPGGPERRSALWFPGQRALSFRDTCAQASHLGVPGPDRGGLCFPEGARIFKGICIGTAPGAAGTGRPACRGNSGESATRAGGWRPGGRRCGDRMSSSAGKKGNCFLPPLTRGRPGAVARRYSGVAGAKGPGGWGGSRAALDSGTSWTQLPTRFQNSPAAK